MPRYKRPADFPTPFIPGASELGLKDPFGSTLGQAAGGPDMVTGGGGGAFPDLDVRDGVTGAVIDAGTETMVINGKQIYWVVVNMNVNGAPGFMIELGSLPYV